jgi:hypothetical protein
MNNDHEKLTGWARWTGPSVRYRSAGEQLLRVVCFVGACSFVVFVLVAMVLYAATIS